jgi:hypothetical protein
MKKGRARPIEAFLDLTKGACVSLVLRPRGPLTHHLGHCCLFLRRRLRPPRRSGSGLPGSTLQCCSHRPLQSLRRHRERRLRVGRERNGKDATKSERETWHFRFPAEQGRSSNVARRNTLGVRSLYLSMENGHECQNNITWRSRCSARPGPEPLAVLPEA